MLDGDARGSGSRLHPLLLLNTSGFRQHRDQGFVYEFVQEAGDLLALPNGWSHATLNLEETLCVAQEYCGCTGVPRGCCTQAMLGSNSSSVKRLQEAAEHKKRDALDRARA